MRSLSQASAYLMVLSLGLLMLLGTLAIHHRRYGRRRCTAEDFLTAGRCVGLWHTSASVVATWVWAATIMVSSRVGYMYGISGPVWYAAGATFQLALFAVLALTIKTRMPLAYTFGEFARLRFGIRAHALLTVYSLTTSVLVTTLVVLGGSRALEFFAGTDVYLAALLVVLSFTSYTMVGGLWASIYTDLVQTAGICLGLLVLAIVLLSRVDLDAVYAGLAKASPGGRGLMVSSSAGLVFGLINAFSMSSTVFVDQAYWGRAIAARDAKTAYWGYIAGSIGWYPVPLVAGLTLGTLGLALGLPIDNPDTVATQTVQAVGGHLGALLFLAVLFMAIISTGDSEAAAVGTIAAIDIFRTYLSPGADETRVIAAARLSIVVFAVLVLAGTWTLLAAGATLWWLFCFYGILLGPAVLPVVLTYLWERGSGTAFVVACLAGTTIGLSVWLTVGLVLPDMSGLGLAAPNALMWGNLSAYATSGITYVGGTLLSHQRFAFASIKSGLPLYAQDTLPE